MSAKELSPGDIIESRCTRCREVRNHTIVALVEGRVARVQCNTCGGIHNYHEIKVPKAKSARTKAPTTAPARTPKKSGGADLKEWESLAPALDGERAIPYSMDGSFRINDIVRHPVFGLGIVKNLAGTGKVEILFQSGKKLLRCR